MESVRKILALLTSVEKRRGALVMLMMVGLAILETSGVVSIMPFLAVLGNPEVVEENEILSTMYKLGAFESTDDFLFWLGVGAFVLVLSGSVFRTLTKYAVFRYTEMRRHSISKRLLETYLRQPYEFFLGRNSGDLAKSILSEVDQLVQNVYKPLLTGLSYGVVAFGIVVLLVIVDPWLALIVGGVISIVYGLIYASIREWLQRIGEDRKVANQERFETAGEALAGIKDIKVLGQEHAYLTRFTSPSERFARHQATKGTLSIIPKYAIEAVGFGGILGLALYLMATRPGLGEVLPLLGLYAFAGYRLLPAAQRIYASVTRLRFGMPAVDEVYNDLKARRKLAEHHKPVESRLEPETSIQLENVSYLYPNTDEPALKDIDVNIPVGNSVGLVGSTGAGKTTTIDLLLGLLEPTDGDLLIDGIPVNDENVRQWQRAIGYVPQEIFLIDGTVAENIAFGVTPEEINYETVKRVAKMAQVHEFITYELADGYETEVGERGVRISGGQRQRIGIARALYHDPPVLIFDEATSSLDTETESEVMKAVNSLRKEKTIVMIAHRFSTVSECDKIYLLKTGKVHAAGTYEKLLKTEPVFRRLAGVAE